jgi:hypothetical protein
MDPSVVVAGKAACRFHVPSFHVSNNVADRHRTLGVGLQTSDLRPQTSGVNSRLSFLASSGQTSTAPEAFVVPHAFTAP